MNKSQTNNHLGSQAGKKKNKKQLWEQLFLCKITLESKIFWFLVFNNIVWEQYPELPNTL